jgi:hypothetical protein
MIVVRDPVKKTNVRKLLLVSEKSTPSGNVGGMLVVGCIITVMTVVNASTVFC